MTSCVFTYDTAFDVTGLIRVYDFVSTFFSLFAIVFHKILSSTLSREIGLKFSRKVLSLFFLGINDMIPRL